MKKIVLMILAAVLGSFSSALASSPSSCLSDGACAASTCCEIKCAEGESAAAAQKRVMTAELTRLVTRYVFDVSLRSELIRNLQSKPERALDCIALVKATLSETDRATFKRVSEYFIKC